MKHSFKIEKHSFIADEHLSVAARQPVATDKWNVNASGDWSNVANWSLGALPNSNDAVVIKTASVQTITHSTGDDTINSLSVGKDHFVLSGGSLEILTKASFTFGFTQTGGTLKAGAVTIKGAGTLTGGGATGLTTLSISGTTALANYTLGGSAVLNNTTTIDQTGQVTLGDNTGANATINNAAAGTYKIAGDFGVGGGAASAVIDNAGLLVKSAGNGTSVIGATTTSTGTISVLSGNLQFNGPSNVISGVVSGPGQLSFAGSGGTVLTLATSTLGALGLYNTAQLTLAGPTSVLNGALIDQSDGTNSLALGSGSLTVNGAATFAGSFGTAFVAGTGALNLTGATTASGAQFGGALTVNNTGVFSETGGVTLGDGSGNVVTLNNKHGATYQFTTNDGLSFGGTSASALVNAGTFSKTGGGTGTSTINVTVSNQAGGIINAATGTMLFTGSLSNAGTISGAGQVAVEGSATLSAGTTLTVAELGLYNSGVLNLATSLTYAGILADNSDGTTTLNLGANTLTLTGTSNSLTGAFGSAIVAGTGRLVNAAGGTLTLAGMVLGGTNLLANSGTVNQTSTVTIGDSSGAVASVSNAKGATWNITNATNIANGAASTSHFDNAGLVTVTAGLGSATIATTFNNAAGATINIASGSLVNSGILSNAGTISGKDLALANSSQTTLAAGSKVQVSSLDLTGAASLSLATNQTFGGTFNDLSNGTDTVNLGANTLTLTGSATFIGAFGNDVITGTGMLLSKGPSSLSAVIVGGTATFQNAGTLLATGGLQIGDGSANAATFLNAANGIYNVVADGGGISHGASLMSDFINNGLFEKTSGTGTTVISSQFVNNGTITVTSGTLEILAGALSGSGVINGVVSHDQSGNTLITHS
ncbi:MAG: hypothetical protein WDN04_11105 [Rhodospirillales bacterium]